MEPSKNGLWIFYTWAEWEVLTNQAELTPSFITFKRDIRKVTSKKGKQPEHPIHKITIIECPTCGKMKTRIIIVHQQEKWTQLYLQINYGRIPPIQDHKLHQK